MALSIYTATGPAAMAPVTQFTLKWKPSASGGFGTSMSPKNLYERYVKLRKYELTVQLQGVVSAGHRVSFYNAAWECVSGGVSDVNGKVTGVFATSDPVTAVIDDKLGGDAYNTMVRAGLVPVAYDAR